MSFANKVVLVTGGSSGIGEVIALKFAEEGANVAIVGRNQERLKNVADNIAKVGNKPLEIIGDLTQESDVRKVVADTLKQFGKLDVLVNNAGVGGRAEVGDENAMEVFDRVMSTNLRSVVYLTHLASKHLIESKGNIVNISSVVGQFVAKGAFAYCTSKAALDHFSRSIALDFASKGVRVNTISPGPVRTEFFANAGTSKELVPATFDALRQATPLKRISDPIEMADLALFLASDKAVGITGSTFVADNGYLIRDH